MENIVLNIKSTQEINGQVDVTEFMTVAKLESDDNQIILSYEEDISSGMEGVTTTLIVDDNDVITLERSGNVSGGLIVEQGKHHVCSYGTQFGDITIGIFGDKVINGIKKTGRLFMRYSIDVNSELLSKNKVEIKISEDEN